MRPSSPAGYSPVPPPTPQQTGRRVLVNTGALAGSSLWRIAISFLLQLTIARQLGVVSFGQYTIALAYLNVCQIISELGLPALLIRDLAQQPTLRRSYFFGALRIQLIAAIVTWGGLFGITALLPLPPTTRWLLWLIGASLPFYAVTSVCQVLFQSGERMEFVMGVELFINTLILGASLLVIAGGGNIQQLIAVLVVTQIISAVVNLLLLWRCKLLAGEQKFTNWPWSQLWRRAGPFFSLALADVFLQRADIMLLSIFGGEVVVGIYGAAYNLLRVGLKLIQSFWAALYPTLSRLCHQQPTYYRRLAHFGLHYGLLALLVVAAVGVGIASDILHFIYNAEYGESVLVLQILLWLAPLYLLENYTQTLLMVEERPLQSLWITGLHLLALVCLLPLLTTFIRFPSMFPAIAVLDSTAGAVLAAFAALSAGGIGAASSIRLIYRWSLPGQIGHPWRMAMSTLLLALISSYLPLAWPWRTVATLASFLILAWLGGLIDVQDGQRLRRMLRKSDAQTT